ncbi:MAG: Holliday junction resolvase RuvX [Bilifractor sp.]|jgi:putative Holliday junction resolvase|nr:Holliday junction resolvase RuvX [Lachnospiraceae bacterium]MDY2838370.1 Holliday junction resolvase RuvX [Bilifractor sp.]
MRILGLDYGSGTVGVAISDPLGLTAQALETIVRQREGKLRQTLARIDEICKEYQVEKIVVGLPLNMNDEPGERARKAEEFGSLVHKRTGLPVIMWDERLTTVAADEILDEMNIHGRHNRKAVIDQIAAGFILQEWLDNCGHKSAAETQDSRGRERTTDTDKG